MNVINSSLLLTYIAIGEGAVKGSNNTTVSQRVRKTIDTTDTMKTFGPVEIHYGKVQQKVTLKYDSRFGGLLGENMHEFHGTVSKVCTYYVFLYFPS